MPLYDYQCIDCGGRDRRVAALDDYMALCADCGGLMLRLDDDVWEPYFEAAADTAGETPAPPGARPTNGK